MPERFQAAALVASPCYPSSVVWSGENLVAVASGHLVTILNPATPFGPRGLITLPANKPFPIGLIKREDLLSPCMLPISLTREIRPCARSISWSPIGFAPNGGCLLAVCTTQGRVKVYRMPFCEYSAEWIEVTDISENLHAYLASVSFGESGILSLRDTEEHSGEAQPNQTGVDGQLVVGSETRYMQRKRQKIENNVHDLGCVAKHKEMHSKRKSSKEVSRHCSISLITAKQYTCRSSMLSSLVVVWSPSVRLTSVVGETYPSNFFGGLSVLAVGAKSGRISFWRIDEPQQYSCMDAGGTLGLSLIGFLQAHDFWVTAVNWSLYESDILNPQLVLATGSSNGSVKIWKACGKELMKPSKLDHAPFDLLKEVVTSGCSSISVLTLFVPKNSQGTMLLAIGKGSGSVEVWIGDLYTSKFEKVGCFSAHEQIVTGLAWAFDGKFLYSCGQDGTMHSWTLRENSLDEVPIPSNTPGLRSSFDVPDVYDSCFGLAVSPGNLAVAVVHSFDSHLLNPMYQERSQKGAVEFLWIGGQQLDLILSRFPNFDIEAFPGFDEKELKSWNSNILWSLNQYDNMDKPLVFWDVLAALSAFKQFVPKFVDYILLKLMGLFFGSKFDFSVLSSEIVKLLPSMKLRQLQILNVIVRHVVLKDLSTGHIDSRSQDSWECKDVERQNTFWSRLLQHSEKEIRERILSLNFSAILKLDSCLVTDFCKFRFWTPIGLNQMMKWVKINADATKDHLIVSAQEVGKIEKRRLSSMCEYVEEEKCSFCSAAVPFESAEDAVCDGVKNGVEVGKRHKLTRCAVSMVVCCPITPPWFCLSCKRRVSNFAPPGLFSLSKYPSDFPPAPAPGSTISETPAKPFCPFCGILLQRLQPEFLLSPSPV